MAKVRAHQNETVDALCHRHYGTTKGVVEAVYAANPGLAELGAILPHGTVVELPKLDTQPATETVINLWT